VCSRRSCAEDAFGGGDQRLLALVGHPPTTTTASADRSSASYGPRSSIDPATGRTPMPASSAAESGRRDSPATSNHSSCSTATS
jgi:hypothetical protein